MNKLELFLNMSVSDAASVQATIDLSLSLTDANGYLHLPRQHSGKAEFDYMFGQKKNYPQLMLS